MITLELPPDTMTNHLGTYTIQTHSLVESLSIPENWMSHRGEILVRIPCCDGLTVIILENRK